MAGVGDVYTVMVLVSLDEQAPFVMVHTKRLVPVERLVTPDKGSFMLVTVLPPAITVQLPVPVAGVFPARVVDVTLHKF